MIRSKRPGPVPRASIAAGSGALAASKPALADNSDANRTPSPEQLALLSSACKQLDPVLQRAIADLLDSSEPRVKARMLQSLSDRAADESKSADFLESVKSIALYHIRRTAHSPLFAQHDVDALNDVSRAEAKKRKIGRGLSLTYGEVTLPGFARILLDCLKAEHKLPSGGQFVDVGSGRGAAIFSALLLGDFDTLIGVEIMQSLHALAVTAGEEWTTKLQKTLGKRFCKPVTFKEVVVHKQQPTTRQQSAAKASETKAVGGSAASTGKPTAAAAGDSYARVTWVCSDFRDFDWTTGTTLVLANSTCFERDIMNALAAQGERLAEGTLFVTFTKQLESPCFDNVGNVRAEMSWGTVTAFVHRRNSKSSNSSSSLPTSALSDAPAAATASATLATSVSDAPASSKATSCAS